MGECFLLYISQFLQTTLEKYGRTSAIQLTRSIRSQRGPLCCVGTKQNTPFIKKNKYNKRRLSSRDLGHRGFSDIFRELQCWPDCHN